MRFAFLNIKITIYEYGPNNLPVKNQFIFLIYLFNYEKDTSVLSYFARKSKIDILLAKQPLRKIKIKWNQRNTHSWATRLCIQNWRKEKNIHMNKNGNKNHPKEDFPFFQIQNKGVVISYFVHRFDFLLRCIKSKSHDQVMSLHFSP